MTYVSTISAAVRLGLWLFAIGFVLGLFIGLQF